MQVGLTQNSHAHLPTKKNHVHGWYRRQCKEHNSITQPPQYVYLFQMKRLAYRIARSYAVSGQCNTMSGSPFGLCMLQTAMRRLLAFSTPEHHSAVLDTLMPCNLLVLCISPVDISGARFGMRALR